MMHNLSREVREYFARMTAESISLPACGGCSLKFLPPRALCPTCGSADIGWCEYQRPGATLYSLTRMANGKTIALAELDVVDGPGRLYAEVVGDAASHAAIGDRVTVATAQQEFDLGTWVPVLVNEGTRP